MYRPPDDSDEDDMYDGFSFGDEFDDVGNHRHIRRAPVAVIRPASPPLSDEQYRDERFLNCIIEGNGNNLVRLLNVYCGNESFNINAPLRQGYNLMLYACQYGRSAMVETLIHFGADPSYSIESISPLIQACKNTENHAESFEICNILLRCGVAVNQSDRCGVTPLMHAAASGNMEIIDHFIKFADLELADNQGSTALFHAVENNRIEVTRLLLDGNCQTNIRNVAGYTPKQIAEFNNFMDLANIFPVEDEYMVPSQYLSNDHYADLAPTAFKYDRKPIYFPDVHTLLLGMSSEVFLPKFAQEFVGLPELLNISDERLIELGVKYPFQRKRIQLGLWKFHHRPWSPWTVRHSGEISYTSMHDLYCLFACHLRHLIIMNESVRYVYLNVHKRNYGTVTEETGLIIGNLRKTLLEIRNSVKKLRMRVAYLEQFNTPKPPLLIESSTSNSIAKSSFTSLLKCSTLILGICLATQIIFLID